MGQIITIATQKGGTGKTTTAHALGAGLILKGYKVLFIDLDPQLNLSYITRAELGGPTAYEVLTLKAAAADAIQQPQAEDPGLLKKLFGKPVKIEPDIIPAGQALSGADMELNQTGKEYRLQEAIEPIRGSYDYIIIDTPPSLGILTVNALTASDSVIIPAQADIFSLQGIGQLYNTVEAVRKYCNPSLTINGILLTRYSLRSVLSRDMTELIADTARQLDTFVYQAVIREGIAVKEAQAQRMDIFTYAPKSNAAGDYMAFVNEMLKSAKGGR